MGVIKRIRHQKNKEISKNLSLIEDLKNTKKLQDDLNLKLTDLESHSVVLLKEKTTKCQELEKKLRDLRIEFDRVSIEKENVISNESEHRKLQSDNDAQRQHISKLGEQLETFKNSIEVIQSKISEQTETITSMKKNLEEKTKQV